MVPEIKNRPSVFDNLRKYDYLAEEADFIEITEWTNGEGWDISFKDRVISLSVGQLEAINHLTDLLRFNA